MSNLNDIEFVNGSISNLLALYSNFERDFPQNERKSIEHLEILMSKDKYKLLLAKHRLLEEIVGYALIYIIEDPKVLWLDYMAVEDKYKNSGYGTLLFNKIIECEGEGKRGMFIEVEIPELDNIDQKRRVQFYERLGAKKLSNDYKLPTLNGGLEMNLYYKVISNEKLLPAEIIKKSITATFNYVHTDIDNRDKILKSFITTIRDEYLSMP